MSMHDELVSNILVVSIQQALAECVKFQPHLATTPIHPQHPLIRHALELSLSVFRVAFNTVHKGMMSHAVILKI